MKLLMSTRPALAALAAGRWRQLQDRRDDSIGRITGADTRV